MADQKITDYSALTTPAAADLLEIVDDVAGTPASKKIELEHLLGMGQSAVNLVKNSPGQIVTDGAEPQWWDDVANAAITDEDTTGETPPDRTERCFKVVTTANDVYGYQTLTFADESLLDAGVTVVSLACWVYCATGSKASIGIYGTNLGLQESSQAGAGAWELLTIENITLNGSDTDIEIRLIVDTDTAWFTQIMLNVGPKPMPWVGRGVRYVPTLGVAIVDLSGSGDVAWSDVDATAQSHALAVVLSCRHLVKETVDSMSSAQMGHSDDIVGADDNTLQVSTQANNHWCHVAGLVMCNDEQVVRYRVLEGDADNDVDYAILVIGYWRWTP